MCRWLAYAGDPIFLDALIFQPENSLVSQSLAAQESHSPTNGDGFGIGWYGAKPEPGLFRDVLPAWNDANLHSVSEQIRSGLFFAHVRASTGTPTSRTNCHPFRHGRHLFMHNGRIGGFDRVRRALTLSLDPDLFAQGEGNTDSEVFFYLALGHGLVHDPKRAFAATVAQVEAALAEAGVDEPLLMTAAVSDGSAIYALRYASHGPAPSLYLGSANDAPDSVLILSEPLDNAHGAWTEVPAGHFLTARDGDISIEPFAPALPLAAE